MPREPAITDIQLGVILAPHEECVSLRSIAGIVNRSVGAVTVGVHQDLKHRHHRQWKGHKKSRSRKKDNHPNGAKGRG